MTFRLSEAEIFVGDKRRRQQRLEHLRGDGIDGAGRVESAGGGGTEPVTAARKPSASGPSRGSSRYSAMCSMSLAALTRALSAMPGRAAWPLRPRTSRPNGDEVFSAAAQV